MVMNSLATSLTSLTLSIDDRGLFRLSAGKLLQGNLGLCNGIGPSRHFAASQQFGLFRRAADKNRIYDGVDAPRRHRCAKSGGVEHHLREGSVSEAFIIGLDIAKYVFHAHGVDERGRAIFSKRSVEESFWIKVWMVMCIHTALENLSIHGSVKEPCRNPQCAYVITASPSFTNFATL